MKGRSLDTFLAELDHPRKAEIERLVELALAAKPGVTGHVKWNAPSFCHGGEDRVTMRLHPAGKLQLVFHRGPKPKSDEFRFEDETGLLKMVAPDRGIVELEEGAVEPAGPLLQALIARWMEATAP